MAVSGFHVLMFTVGAVQVAGSPNFLSWTAVDVIWTVVAVRGPATAAIVRCLTTLLTGGGGGSHNPGGPPSS